MNKRLLFLFTIIFWNPNSVTGQWSFGIDSGHLTYDVIDEIISPNQFQGSGRSLINPVIFHISEQHYFSIRYGFKKTTLYPERDFSALLDDNYLEFQNYELDIEYLRNVLKWRNLSSYLGLAYFGHFTFINRYLDTRFLDSSQSSHELTALNISLSGMLRYDYKQTILLYKTGIGFLGYGSRPESNFRGSFLNYQTLTPDNYIDWVNSFSAVIPVSENVSLKPEYRFRYYRYENPRPFSLLKQTFFLGIFVTL